MSSVLNITYKNLALPLLSVDIDLRGLYGKNFVHEYIIKHLIYSVRSTPRRIFMCLLITKLITVLIEVEITF